MESNRLNRRSLKSVFNTAFASGVGSVIDITGRSQYRSLFAAPRRESSVALAWQRVGRCIASAMKQHDR